MKVLCVEKADKVNKIKSMLNVVSYNNNKMIIHSELSKINLKNKIKIIKKMRRIILKEKIDKVMLSNIIKQDKELMNLIYSNNIKITNDRWIFKMLTDEVIYKFIAKEKRKENEIWITVNDVDNITQNIIYKFAKEFKRVNIITNHIRKFKKIEEKLYEEDGIMITITNNRRKSLLKAGLILNIDFPKELLNQFAIFDQAIIINLEGDMAIKKKRFNGKVINNIDIKSCENEEIREFIETNELKDYDFKDICDILNIVPKCDIMLV